MPDPDDNLKVLKLVAASLRRAVDAMEWPSDACSDPLRQLLNKGLATTAVSLVWSLPHGNPLWAEACRLAHAVFRFERARKPHQPGVGDRLDAEVPRLWSVGRSHHHENSGAGSVR